MKKTLLILAHPNLEQSVFNSILIDGVRDLGNLTIRHLDSLYGGDTKAIDVPLEQQFLMEHDRIVFQFPWYWYSSPAMLKAYLDEVFTYGFAFGQMGDKLRGKELKIASTIGAPEYAYQSDGFNNFTINQLTLPFRQTAYKAGMKYTEGFFLYGSGGSISRNELMQRLIEYKKILTEKWQEDKAM
ncbi:NAD(P)H-dependent oxidoreductase [Vibrio sp. JC009]|uniref:NAD(P)H-dependent oxidoreductase n=1 Tax=Vibrio sp. JC009 TaxID=2912314 RepID=UPI0023AEECEC|nr:NAD(P)H-dependent oxidoreductase [Vibrio sp. JC009]WED23800.1 NAD(P)H-dependent oxidoreductase [Vibrio sp. JC009]